MTCATQGARPPLEPKGLPRNHLRRSIPGRLGKSERRQVAAALQDAFGEHGVDDRPRERETAGEDREGGESASLGIGRAGLLEMARELGDRRRSAVRTSFAPLEKAPSRHFRFAVVAADQTAAWGPPKLRATSDAAAWSHAAWARSTSPETVRAGPNPARPITVAVGHFARTEASTLEWAAAMAPCPDGQAAPSPRTHFWCARVTFENQVWSAFETARSQETPGLAGPAGPAETQRDTTAHRTRGFCMMPDM